MPANDRICGRCGLPGATDLDTGGAYHRALTDCISLLRAALRGGRDAPAFDVDALMEVMREPHEVCEDGYYTCASQKGALLLEQRGLTAGVCSCGADERNAERRAALKAALGAAQPPKDEQAILRYIAQAYAKQDNLAIRARHQRAAEATLAMVRQALGGRQP